MPPPQKYRKRGDPTEEREQDSEGEIEIGGCVDGVVEKVPVWFGD